MERDYILRHAKDMGKILALLLGLAKKEDFATALEVIAQTLEQTFDLKNDFEINDLLEKWARKELAIADFKNIAQLLVEKGRVYEQLGDEAIAKNCYKKAFLILKTYQTETPMYDLAVQRVMQSLKF